MDVATIRCPACNKVVGRMTFGETEFACCGRRFWALKQPGGAVEYSLLDEPLLRLLR